MPHLLALSHSGVLEVNRGLYQTIARVSEVSVTLVVPARWKGDLIEDLRYEPAASDRDIRVVPLGVRLSGRGSLFSYRTTRTLERLAAEAKPDVVLIDEEPWSLAARQAARAFHASPLCFTTKENLERRYPPPFRWWERRFLARTRLALAASEDASAVLRGWKAYRGPIEALPFPYDPARFRPLGTDERDAARGGLGVGPGRFVVGYSGRLVPEKGIAELIEMVERTTKEPALDHVDFLIVGNGPLRESLRAVAARAPQRRVHLLDAVPHADFGRVLATMDVLVVPSRTTPRWKEQFGRVIVEAMACGVPVVGSDSGEIPHLIRRTGGGLVTREGNVDDLFEAVGLLARDPLGVRALGRAGSGYVGSHFTNEAVARRLIADLRSHALL